MKKAENGLDWIAALSERRPDPRPETVLAKLESRVRRAEGRFNALKLALSDRDRALLPENMMSRKFGANGSYASHFLVLSPESMSSVVGAIRELLHIGTEGQPSEREKYAVRMVMERVITPFVKKWEELLEQFSNFYEDKHVGADLKNLFGCLQYEIRLLWTAKDRIRSGMLHFDREKYTKAFEAFVTYYQGLKFESGKNVSKPSGKGKVFDKPKTVKEIREAIIKKLRGEIENWFNGGIEGKQVRAKIINFYRDVKLWKNKGWMSDKGVRHAFDKSEFEGGEDGAIASLVNCAWYSWKYKDALLKKATSHKN